MTVSSSPMSSTVSTSLGTVPPARLGSFESLNAEVSAPSSQIEPDFSDSDETELLSVSWNQDYKCFAAGTSRGFRIYNCDPLKETFRRDLTSGGFRIVEMLFQCQILALVGGKFNSQYPQNKVVIWDDQQSRCIGEFSFRSEVRAVKLRKDRIVIVFEHQIYIYGFRDLRRLHQIETIANPGGLCCLSHHLNTCVLACPGLQRGQVRIEHFGLNMTKIINAHGSQLACLTLTLDGLILATASTKGTLVRIFNTMDGTQLQEGSLTFSLSCQDVLAFLYKSTQRIGQSRYLSIALSPNVQWLAVSSDKGTVHIFSLRVRVVEEDSSTRSSATRSQALSNQNSSSSVDAPISTSTVANPRSSLSFLKGVLPKYFSSEWSFAQFHVPECTHFIAAFGSLNTVVIVGMDGSFYRCSFDPVNGGEMTQQEYVRFLETDRQYVKI